ncbi:MAG: ribosomal RNA small subunit methyltransferase A [Planctomycetaceae bacterium]
MGAHPRAPRAAGSRPDGQHLLRSRLVADELVRDAGIGPTDHVVELGAGTGRLTRPLAERAGRVTAIELDPAFAERLRRAFDGHDHVRIVEADVASVPVPERPWRAFGNIPFGLTAPILRRLLDDVAVGPERADLLLQFEAARKRAAVVPSTLLSLGWQPWWELTLARRIPRLGFEPPPSVDAGLLVITRRRPALLAPSDRVAYLGPLRRAFDRGSWPVRRSLQGALPPMTWKRLARERGLHVDARPADLDVWDWVAVFRAISERRGSGAGSGARA